MKASDARPQRLLPSAWPVFRQSVVKEAPGTTGNVRRCRPPVFTGAAWHLASDAQAMLVPSHVCLTFGKGRVKLSPRRHRNSSARELIEVELCSR